LNNDFFSIYFDYVAETEPPAVFHRWSIIASIGAMLGRRLWFPFGTSKLLPNHFVMLVGDPGARKSTAIKRATKLISATGYSTFSGQRSSKEKFLSDLAGLDDEVQTGFVPRKKESGLNILANLNLPGADLQGNMEPAEMFVANDEFNNFMGSGNLDFQSLLGELWDWDDPDRPYKHRLQSRKSIAIYQPTVSILGGNTPTGFAECFPLASIGQGFMSRLILVHSEPSGKKITFPPPPAPETVAKLVGFLSEMRAVCQGEVKLDIDAESALDTIYKGWPEMEDTRFRHYSTRRFTHLLKLCMVVAATRLSTRITMLDVIHANTILAYAEGTMPKAIGELGKSKNAEASNKIMQVLYNARKPLEVRDLWKIVQNDLDKIQDLSNLLVNLQTADKIQVIQGSGGSPGYLPKIKPASRSAPYTNFELLKGKEIK
jgi:hypothetical protein